MTIRSVGGGDWFYNPASGAGQRAVTNAVGLNNVGLLVTTWGRVVSSGEGYFIISDGSLPPFPAQVKVALPSGAAPRAIGTFVTVTGVVSCENVGGSIIGVLLPRFQTDIVDFPGAGP